MKENTFFEQREDKGINTRNDCFVDVKLCIPCFAEQTGGNAANPANEATNTLNDLTSMLRIIFPSAAVIFGADIFIPP